MLPPPTPSSSVSCGQRNDSTISGLYQRIREEYGKFSEPVAKSCDEWECAAVQMKLLGYATTCLGEYMSKQSSQRNIDDIPILFVELIECFPNSDQEFDFASWLPLHWAVAGCPSISARDIELILQRSPQLARQFSHTPSRFLPVHSLSCSAHPRLDIADDLLAAYPFSAMQATTDGLLPLHFAARYTASVPFLQLLLQANYKGLRHTTHNQLNCLHFAIDNPCKDVFEALLALWPEGARETIKNAESPFQYAVRIGNASAVASMLQSDSSLSRVTFSTNELPLHFACRCSNLEVVTCLLSFDTNVVYIPSGPSYNFPLHQAVLSPCDDVFKLILDHTPCVAPKAYIVKQLQQREDQTTDGQHHHQPNADNNIVPPPLPPTQEAILDVMKTWLLNNKGNHPFHILMKSEFLTRSRAELFLNKYFTHFAAISQAKEFSTVLGAEKTKFINEGFAISFLFLMRNRMGDTPLHVLINSFSIPSVVASARSMEAFKFLLKNAPEACLLQNRRLEFPIHCFAYAIDKLLGCCTVQSGATIDKPSTSPNRRKIRVHRQNSCEIMRLLLTNTNGHAINPQLPTHQFSMHVLQQHPSAELLLRDESLLPMAPSSSSEEFEVVLDVEEYGMHRINMLDERNFMAFELSQFAPEVKSFLQLPNLDGESVYDLLTRSSESVHISNSFNGAKQCTDDGIVAYCTAPAHQQLDDTQVDARCERSADESTSLFDGPYAMMPSPSMKEGSVKPRDRAHTASSLTSTSSVTGTHFCTRSLLKRMLLQCHPEFNKPLLRELNYRARRMGLFLGFCAGTIFSESKRREVNIFAKLRR